MMRGVFILAVGVGIGYAAALEHHEGIAEKLQTLNDALTRDIAEHRALRNEMENHRGEDSTTKGETPS